MKPSLCKLAPAAVALLFGITSAATPQRFTGSDNGRPPAFSVAGPWTLDWSTKSEFPLLDSSFELRLYDEATGEFLGELVEMSGTGSGTKVFEKPGTYRFAVVARSLSWELLVEEISGEQAEKLKRSATGRTNMLDATRERSNLVPESSFASWRPDGDATLLLFDKGQQIWRITFSPPCPGLGSATALSFVMQSADGAVGQYDSILLDDGHRCYFASVVPGLVP